MAKQSVGTFGPKLQIDRDAAWCSYWALNKSLKWLTKAWAVLDWEEVHWPLPNLIATINWWCLLHLIKAWKNLEHLSACRRYLFLMSWATFIDSAFLSRIICPLVRLAWVRKEESKGFCRRELSRLLYSASASSTQLEIWLNSWLYRNFKWALRDFNLLLTLNMLQPLTWWLQPSA